MKELTLYTKSGCRLCDEMKVILNGLEKHFEFDLEEIDIVSDKRLYEKYKEKIPVLLIDGKMFAKFVLDEAKLRNKLSK